MGQHGSPTPAMWRWTRELQERTDAEMMNEKGHVVFRFLHDCWVSEFTSLPELNSKNAPLLSR